MPNGKWIFMITSLYSVRLKNLWIDRIALKTITSNSRKLSWRERKVITTSLACVEPMAFHFRQNSMFHFTLYFAQSVLHFVFVIWVCTRDSIFCIQHSTSIYATFKFLLSTFNFLISNSQVFEFDLQVQWNVHSFFRIQHLSFKFSLPTSDFGHCTCKFPYSTFNFSNWTFTRWSATDGDRGLNWPNPPQLKWWSRGDVLHRVIKAADRQDAVAPAN